MFDITSAHDFYRKLLEEFDDFMQQSGSARHAMNFAITAHHMADWVWGDVVKGDPALKAKIGIKTKDDFMAWIDTQSVWYGLVQGISNGSKHFIRENAKGTQKVQGFGMGGFGQGPYGQSCLAIEVSATDPKYLEVSMLFEVVVRFWRDFMRLYCHYDDLPKGQTKLSDEQS